MKRLALPAVLAAAALGSGCIVTSSDSTDHGDVNVYWDFVRSAPAQPGGVLVYDDSDVGAAGNGPCDESGVEVVEVDSPAGKTVVDCVYQGVEGVGIDRIGVGTRSFRFRGWRGNFLVYDTTRNLAVNRNTVTDHFVDLAGVSAPLDLFAYLAYGAGPTDYTTCAAATPAGSSVPPNIDFEIRDVFGTLIDNGIAGCVGALPALVFAGDLDLDNYRVRMRGYRVEDGAVVFDSCSVPFDHFVSQTGVNGVAPTLLTQPVPTCP